MDLSSNYMKGDHTTAYNILLKAVNVVHIHIMNHLELDEFLECMLHKTDACDDAAHYMGSHNLHSFI